VNIFCTDPDPVVSAEALDDKRVMKMIVEGAQMLSTALHRLRPDGWEALNSGLRSLPWDSPLHQQVYKPVFPNHPCNLWVRASSGNWDWLMSHTVSLCSLYRRTYGREHLCTYTLQELWNESRIEDFPKRDRTPFPNCARNLSRNLDFSYLSDTHEAYRFYLRARWQQDVRPPTWRDRRLPEWLLAK